jgi:uncharacterized protein YdhG (YjbR/CyaY superfamily)
MKSPSRQPYASVDEYLAAQEDAVRERLAAMCRVIRQAAPKAEGRISYGMPAFFYRGRLVYFCAFKKHIGFYPASMTVFKKFKDDLEEFKQSGRGTVQFPHDAKLPTALIKKIVAFRVRENEASARLSARP